MKVFSAALAALALFAGVTAADARSSSSVFTDLSRTAPRSVFDSLRDSAPRSPFDALNETAPRSIFDTIRDSAPRSGNDGSLPLDFVGE